MSTRTGAASAPLMIGMLGHPKNLIGKQRIQDDPIIFQVKIEVAGR